MAKITKVKGNNNIVANSGSSVNVTINKGNNELLDKSSPDYKIKLIEKLNFLRKERVITYDAEKKFGLDERIKQLENELESMS